VTSFPLSRRSFARC